MGNRMYRKEVNKRSPMRVFERSIHGGLGPGNIGVVMARHGVGKTAFLVGLALDYLMRDRKVLHVDTKNPAERVREFYDEVFHELAETSALADKMTTQLQIERNRMIHTFVGDGLSMERVRGALGYMREHMDFVPSAIILDGYPDWETVTEEQIVELKKLASDVGCELWLSAFTHREGQKKDERGVPEEVAKFDGQLSVLLELRPEGNHVKLQLLKDHDNSNLADLHIELEPNTLLLAWH